MTDWYGWQGRILRVDLSSGKITKEPLPEDLAHNFLGGRGINSRILYDETGPETDPLGPDNRVIVGTGPMTGTMLLGTGRFTVTAKSPMSGILGDGSGGGHFGAEVKFAGYDHIIVQGRSDKPVYLYVNDDDVQIRDASHLWGKTTSEASVAIREELGDRYVRSLIIGPAGEHLSYFACGVTDEGAVPAKTGTGAVMGSKNLKAISARGSKSVRVADPASYEPIIRKWWETMPTIPFSHLFKGQGTAWLVKLFNETYGLGVRNAQEVHKDGIEDFYGERFVPKYKSRDFACFSCRLPCEKFMRVYDGPYAGEKGRRPEFGPLASLCTHLGVFSFPFGLKVTNLLNEYGMGAEELGPTIAMIFELYQRGILTRKDTDGLQLEWGNQDVILEMVRKIAYREGFGDVVADGCVRAAKKIGKGAEKYTYQIKGLTHPDAARTSMPWVLGFAVSTRGWDHLRTMGKQGPHPAFDYTPGEAELTREGEHSCTLADALEICKQLRDFSEVYESWEPMADVLSAVTGVKFTEERLHEACERIYNVERSYLVRHGIRRKDDVAPSYYYDVPLQSGPHKGEVVDRAKFEQLKDAWYDLRGQDRKTGAPTRAALEKLGLKSVADDLEKTGVYQE